MADKLIKRAAELMREQAAVYVRLNSLCRQLNAALVGGDPDSIESLARTGEQELLGLRARQAQITSALSQFAAMRTASPDRTPLSAATRTAFEAASNELTSRACEFQQTRGRAAALAINGVVFSGACIEMCGVQPTTYGAPYVRRKESRPWA